MTKKALILGGSSGIGMASVRKLAESFDEIVVVHRDRKQGTNALKEEIERIASANNCMLTTHNIDATDKEKVDRLVSTFSGKFDLVLHAITRGNLGNLDTKSDNPLGTADLALTMDAMCLSVQLWSSMLIAKGLLGQESRFITLTSEGSSRVWNGYSAVGIAKSALETLTKYLAVEMSERGIRYNCIQAGVTDTPSLRLIPGHDELITLTKERNPYGRLTLPKDVANAIYLLTLPEAGWINGTIIHVDGGEHLA